MQPEISPSTTPSAEHLPPAPIMGPEGMPSLPPLDARFEQGQQRVEQAAEAGARASDAAAPAATAVPVAPQAPVAPPPQAPSASTSATPLVAADEDLIEKEWVDKAKQIIEQTKDDPHARSKMVTELQRDYMQKRYGKVIGATE